MKTLTAVLSAVLLAGCAHNPVAPVTRPLAQVAAKQLEGLHGLVGKPAVIKAAHLQPDGHNGKATFTVQVGGQTVEIAVVAFYNDAPRVLSDSVLVQLNGDQLLDDTHIQDAAQILAAAKTTDAALVKKAVGWLADKQRVKY
jgi:hypothetical protein